DTQEHGFPDTACIALRLSQAVYRPLFEQVWGAGSLAINFPFNSESICATPGGAAVFRGNVTPTPVSPADRTKATAAHNHWGESISFYEDSMGVSAYSSKFDAFLANNYTLTPDEMAGFNLFNGKGNCNSCHIDGRGTGQTDTSATASVRPLFTCFGYANL